MATGFLADENIPRLCLIELRESGFDVTSIAEIARSVSDSEGCAIAQSQERIIITADKDFGDLVVRERIRVPGVILLRVNHLPPKQISVLLKLTLEQNHDWYGHFSVVAEDSIRVRSLRIG